MIFSWEMRIEMKSIATAESKECEKDGMIAEIDIHVLIKFHINSKACDILWIALLYISIIL